MYGSEKKSWTSALFAYAEGEKSRLLLSVVLSVLSVMLGLVPFYCMYRLICLMAAGTATAALAVCGCVVFFRIVGAVLLAVLPEEVELVDEEAEEEGVDVLFSSLMPLR